MDGEIGGNEVREMLIWNGFEVVRTLRGNGGK